MSKEKNIEPEYSRDEYKKATSHFMKLIDELMAENNALKLKVKELKGFTDLQKSYADCISDRLNNLNYAMAQFNIAVDQDAYVRKNVLSKEQLNDIVIIDRLISDLLDPVNMKVKELIMDSEST